MNFNKKEICEVCFAEITDWSIGKNCVLFKCSKCEHIKRDINLCNYSIRESAWGGSGLFDKVRASLTILRLNNLLPKNKKLSVLEIGFGSGEILKKFIKKNFKVYGIETGDKRKLIDASLKKKSYFIF